MNIVLPVHHFPPRYTAGAELYTFRMARWLQAHGHNVEVVCVEAIDQGRAGELCVEADSYEDVPVQRLMFNMAACGDPQRWSYDNPLLGSWFQHYFDQTNPDIVHFQAGYLLGCAPLYASHAAAIPTVLTLHDYWFLCPRITLQRGDGSLCNAIPDNPDECAWCMRLESRRYRLPNQLTKGLLGRLPRIFIPHTDRSALTERRQRLMEALLLPDAIIAPSRFLADRFAHAIPPERLHIARLGLDLRSFQGCDRPPCTATFQIGFIGQIAPHKGVHLLVEAFRALRTDTRPAELHIYGGLSSHPRYVQRLQALAGGDPRIHFHGRLENQRVAEVLRGFQVVVVPSIWYENSPLAILEAQAAGTPVVTAALGGMAELVCDGVDGLHFRPADTRDLARQLQRLLDEPSLVAQLQAGVVMPRSIDDEMQQILEIYQEVSVHTL